MKRVIRKKKKNEKKNRRQIYSPKITGKSSKKEAKNYETKIPDLIGATENRS